MVIFNYIHRLYNYIKNVICITFYSNKKTYYISNRDLYHMNQDDECDFNDGNRDEEHEDDTEDNFDEEAILNIPDSKQYLHVKSNILTH